MITRPCNDPPSEHAQRAEPALPSGAYANGTTAVYEGLLVSRTIKHHQQRWTD